MDPGALNGGIEKMEDDGHLSPGPDNSFYILVRSALSLELLQFSTTPYINIIVNARPTS